MYLDVHGRADHRSTSPPSSFARSTFPAAMSSHGYDARRFVVSNPREVVYPGALDPPVSVSRRADVESVPFTTSLRGARGADTMDYEQPARHVSVPMSLAVNASAGSRKVRPTTLDERFKAIAAIRIEQERKRKEKEDEEEERRRKTQAEKQAQAATQARMADALQRQREARNASVEARRRSFRTNGQDQPGSYDRAPTSYCAPATVKRDVGRRDPPGSVPAGTRVNPPVRDRLGPATAGNGAHSQAKGARDVKGANTPAKIPLKDRNKVPIANRLTFGDAPMQAPGAFSQPQVPISARLNFAGAAGMPGGVPGGAPGKKHFHKQQQLQHQQQNAGFGAAVFGLGQSQGAAGAVRQQKFQKKGGAAGGQAGNGARPAAKGKALGGAQGKSTTFDDLDQDLDSYWTKKDD